MLTLVTGRAGTGKTAFIMDEMKRRMNAGEYSLLFIIPEQYSHDAERRLSAICGDKLSLHGEILSFSRLCGRVLPYTGGERAPIPDGGGQILIMQRALDSVARDLKVFGTNVMRTELLERLLGAVKELRTLNIPPDILMSMAELASYPLSDKLRDLSLVSSAYEALLSTYGGDREDELTRLADEISDSKIGDTGHIYFDGFNDFTAREMRVIEELLRKDAQLTICLTYAPDDDDAEAFELPRRTANQLRRIAAEQGVAVSVTEMDMLPAGKAPELVFLEKHLFGFAPAAFPQQCGAVTLYSAGSRYAECEYAASKVLELVRGGYRWRDVGVMARDWDVYGRICENVFEKYGVPFFSGGRTDVLDKPAVALIDAALEIAVSGWEYKSVFKYLKTGLPGAAADICAELENYVLKWNIRGTIWTREWTLPPSGYGGADDLNALPRINELRGQIVRPLALLRAGIKNVTEVNTKLRALYIFLEDIMLPQRLAEKAAILEKRGDARLADEYAQIWDIIVNAMEQTSGILGDSKLGAAEFRKLFLMTLSHYDVGTIPVSLDRTALGGMAMSRRRDLKCLIIVGATDDCMPMLTGGGGVLSDSEREEMAKIASGMPAGLSERLYREMNMLYSTLTLPSRELVISYPAGAGERPSFIVKRIKSIFGITETGITEDEYMAAAETPCFELASLAGNLNGSLMAKAAREYFFAESGSAADRLNAAEIMLRAGRGRLSRDAAALLYGQKPSLSASRVDKYFSCPYAHFLRSGLKLDARAKAGFDAPTAGVFMHYVLENVSREIKGTVGFKNADEELCKGLIASYIEKYVHEVLFDFENAGSRFIYLFYRIEEVVRRVVLDMMDELKLSDFEPLDFELNFSELCELAGDDKDGLSLSGVIDRVDGCFLDDKLFLRVIDYKTGSISFGLSDVLYGRKMQMLIYLFALQKYGGSRYGGEIVPAGVLYVPARDVILKAPRNVTDDKLTKMRADELRRDGLILSDPLVLEAMESGETKKYLPVKFTKDGAAAGDSLVSPEQLALLSGHVGDMLRRAAREIVDGDMECIPFYKSAVENACMYCEYGSVCGFDEAAGDRRRFIRKMSAEEIWRALSEREPLRVERSLL